MKTKQKEPMRLVVLGGGQVADFEVVEWMFRVEAAGGAFEVVEDVGVLATLLPADAAYFKAHGAEAFTSLLELPSEVM
jgi:hypothetical protein